MPTTRLTKRVKFCAAHRLHNPAWTDERNREVYGKCNSPAGHGHTYVLEVTVEGERNPDTGMVVNLTTLGDIIKRDVVSILDHRNLNVDVPFLQGKVTTVENLAEGIWDILEGRIPSASLSEIAIYESEDSWIRYRK